MNNLSEILNRLGELLKMNIPQPAGLETGLDVFLAVIALLN